MLLEQVSQTSSETKEIKDIYQELLGNYCEKPQKQLIKQNETGMKIVGWDQPIKGHKSKLTADVSTQCNIEEPEVTNEMDNCIICMSVPRQYAFIPCGHFLCCGQCQKEIMACPVCKKKIVDRLKIFFS